ncbi:MAG: ester cyclase [Gammaproteobacteria bacterium]
MNKHSILFWIAIVLLPACGLAGETRIHCEGQEANRDTYLAMHKILFMERDGSRVGEFYAPEFISHNQDEGGGSQELVTHSDMAAMWEQSKLRTPNRVMTNNLILCVDDFVIARVVMKGHRVGLPGQEPGSEGRYYEASAIDIYRFENGKVVERWGNNDGVTIMRQLGLLPAAGSD